jgi:hypothetical protein
MNEEPDTLDGMISMLQSFGPSIVLVRCLVLARRLEEAREVSKQVAATETARLSAASNLPIIDTSELRLRTTFAEAIAGRRRNARILLSAFIGDAERAATRRPDTLGQVAPQLAIAAIIVNDPTLSTRAAELLTSNDSLPVRVLRALREHAVPDLRACLQELNRYIGKAAIPPWSDTWHHVLAAVISDALSERVV